MIAIRLSFKMIEVYGLLFFLLLCFFVSSPFCYDLDRHKSKILKHHAMLPCHEHSYLVDTKSSQSTSDIEYVIRTDIPTNGSVYRINSSPSHC